MLDARVRRQKRLPLLVIGAGNDRDSAQMSGAPAVRLDFPDIALVVAGSTPRSGSAWHRWGYQGSGRGKGAGSNFGDQVDVYAPGDSVIWWSKVLSQFFVGAGTSPAGALVAGIAGLMLSMD